MQHNLLSDYLAEIEAGFQTLKACHYEKYVEEILGTERANLRVRARFATGHLLEANEAVTIVSGDIAHLSYRYHFQDKNNTLIFRYDNTPHFPDLATFPNHKHLPDRVVAIMKPSLNDVIKEVNQHLLAS